MTLTRLFTVLGVLTLPVIARAEAALPPTFSKDVAPILFDNCVSCHRSNEVAPFTLTSYDDAKRRAKTIVRVTEERFMPPWKAVPGHGEFQGVRRLTDEQIATLRVWADAGAPEGDPKQTPALPKFTDGWQLGEPDLVVQMPEAYTLKSEGRDVYRCFVLPLNLDEDRFVEAVEYRPGNRKIVHHALFFLDTTGKGRALDAADPGLGYAKMGGPGFTPTGSLGGWAPGYTPQRLPEGVARRVQKGSDLVMQVHFHPSGKEETERSSIGIHFSKKVPTKLFASVPRAIRRFEIPPGETDYVLRQENDLPMAADLIGITPHAHLLCKEIKVDATLPDGTAQPLIWIKDWDFNWQGEYQYAKPLHIPAGSKVAMEFRYDNSKENPAQPSDPPRPVTWGEQTTDEMAIIFYHVLIDPAIEEMFRNAVLNRARQDRIAAPGNGNEKREEKPAATGGVGANLRRRLIERFDANKNGRLDPEERRAASEAFGGRRATE